MKYFKKTYIESRERFFSYQGLFKQISPETGIFSFPVGINTYIDIIHVPATSKKPEHTLIWQNGQHGIDGFFGDAYLNFFINKHNKDLNLEQTEIFLIHVINPSGMVQKRRNNSRNVDLNRNFFMEESSEIENKSFSAMKDFFIPEKIYTLPGFLIEAIRMIRKHGAKAFEEAATAGQTETAQAIYFAGKKHQVETETLINFYSRAFLDTPQITLLDFHTGYGRRGEIKMINSSLEKRPVTYWKALTGYKKFIQCASSQMYEIKGDIIDYTYKLAEKINPSADYYGVCVEAGTAGNSKLSNLNAVRKFINENTLYLKLANVSLWKKSRLKKTYIAHFIPNSPLWKNKILKKTDKCIYELLKKRNIL